MGIPLDLEALREVLKDNRTHLAIAKVKSTELSSDNATLFAECTILFQERDVIARVTWPSVGSGGGIFQFPQKDDLVLLAFAEGDADQCFLVQRLSSRADTIPVDATGGHTVIKSIPGKKLHLKSDTKINIGKSNGDFTEAVVLGNILKTFLTNVLNSFLNGSQIGFDSFGLPVFLDPTIRNNFTTYKSTYLDTASTNILSQVAFTERGN